MKKQHDFWALIEANRKILDRAITHYSYRFPAISREDNKDLTNFVIEKFFDKKIFDKFDPSRGNLPGFIYGHVRAILSAEYCKTGKRSEHLLPASFLGEDEMNHSVANTSASVDYGSFTQVDPSTSVEDDIDYATLRERISELLNDQEAEVLRLLVDEGNTGNEVAGFLNLNSMKISRIRKSLKEKLSVLLPDLKATN